jgi:hypothetical protein
MSSSLAGQAVYTKGVGPSMTLAWPGWKQSDIAVEVDTGRLEKSQFKKCCANCVLLYFPSTEFKGAFNVYWHGGGAAGLSCTDISIWEFPFLRGVCWQGWTSIWFCEKGMPQIQGHPGQPAYTCMLSYSIIVFHLSFNFLSLLLLYSIYLCGIHYDTQAVRAAVHSTKRYPYPHPPPPRLLRTGRHVGSAL